MIWQRLQTMRPYDRWVMALSVLLMTTVQAAVWPATATPQEPNPQTLRARAELKKIAHAVHRYQTHTQRPPRHLGQLLDAGLRLNMHDPWGGRYRYHVSTSTQRITVRSHGPDRRPLTHDDVILHLRSLR